MIHTHLTIRPAVFLENAYQIRVRNEERTIGHLEQQKDGRWLFVGVNMYLCKLTEGDLRTIAMWIRQLAEGGVPNDQRSTGCTCPP